MMRTFVLAAALMTFGMAVTPSVSAAETCSSITIGVEIEQCRNNTDGANYYTVAGLVSAGNFCNGEPSWNSYTHSCTRGVSVAGETVGVTDGPSTKLCVETPVGCYGRT